MYVFHRYKQNKCLQKFQFQGLMKELSAAYRIINEIYLIIPRVQDCSNKKVKIPQAPYYPPSF